MATPLIEALQTRHGVPVVDSAQAQAFVDDPAGPPDRILFFTGDPVQRPEANDVAVVLPQLLEAFEGKFSAAVVDRGAEEELKAVYGVMFLPSLVFLRGGAFVGVIPKIQDWTEYVNKAGAFLSAPARPLGGASREGEA